MRKLLHLGAAVALVGAPSLAAQGVPAALVVRVDGVVNVSHGGADPAPAGVGERLEVGDEVMPSSGSRAILITRTGGQQVVTESTEVAEPQGGGNPGMFERAMATLAQAASADARTAGGRQGMIRPIPGEPVLVAPRNGLTVNATRPTFQWMEVEGAPGYQIQVRQVDGEMRKRFRTGPETTWTYPADEPALSPGQTYAWTVAPLRGRPTREQQFRVISDDEFEMLTSYLGEIEMLGMDPEGDGLFLAAVAYRELDLFYDARAAIKAVEAAGTMSAELYLLKGEILNYLGHAEEAQEAFDKADELMR